MNVNTQWQVLQKLADDVGIRVHRKVICEHDSRTNFYHFHLKCPQTTPKLSGRVKKVFGFATIKPKQGYLLVDTWEELFTSAELNNMPSSVSVKKMQWNKDGRKWEIYEPDGVVYREAVYSLALACKAAC